MRLKNHKMGMQQSCPSGRPTWTEGARLGILLQRREINMKSKIFLELLMCVTFCVMGFSQEDSVRCSTQATASTTLGTLGNQNLVVVFVDFRDGRKHVGNDYIEATTDADLNLVDNLNAVGSMGYIKVGDDLVRKARKYSYDNYWDMLFSNGTFTGAAHPDSASHGIIAYGSVKDYYSEVSYGTMTLTPYVWSSNTDKYHTGIANAIDSSTGTKYLKWILLPGNKSQYNDPAPTSEAEDELRTAYSNGEISFDIDDYLVNNKGRILVVMAGGGSGGIAERRWMGVREKRWENSDQNSTLDGIWVAVHEFGHTCNFGHLSCGSYDPMVPTFSNNWTKILYSPPHFNPLSKLRAGWISTADFSKIRSTTTDSLPASHLMSHKFAVVTLYGDALRDDDDRHSEYFVLEYRTREGFNRFSGGVGATTFPGGVLVWHHSPYVLFFVDYEALGELDSDIGLKVASPHGFVHDGGDPSHFFYSGHNELSTSSSPVNSNSLENTVTGLTLSNFTVNGAGQILINVNYTIESVPQWDYLITKYSTNLPNYISGNVYLQDDVSFGSLTIANGTQIQFAPGGKMYVSTLIANAATQNSIQFKGTGFGSYIIDWKGIKISSGTGISSMQKCLVSGADVGLAFEFPNYRATIQDNTFTGCNTDMHLAGTGYTYGQPLPEFSGNTFSKMEIDGGIWNFGENQSLPIPSGASLTISSNTRLMDISNISVASGGALIINNGAILKFISGEGYSEQDRGYLSISGKIHADGVTFTKNTTESGYHWAGIYMLNSNPGGDGNWIKNCSISECRFGMTIYNSRFEGSSDEIYNNTFTYCLNPIRLTGNSYVNRITHNTLTSNVEDGIVIHQSSAPTVSLNTIEYGRDGFWVYGASVYPMLTNNIVRHNSQDGIRCEYYGSPYLGGQVGGGTPIQGGNHIHHNTRYGVYAPSTTSPYLGESFYGLCTVLGGYNTLELNGGYQLYTPNNYVLAQANWWGVEPDNGCWDFTSDTKQTLFGNNSQDVAPALRYSECGERAVWGGPVAKAQPTVTPTKGEPIAVQGAATGQLTNMATQKEIIAPEKKLLVLGDQLVMGRLFEQAIAVYDSLIDFYSESFEAEIALARAHFAILKFNSEMEKQQNTTRMKNAAQYFNAVSSLNNGKKLERASLELAAINAGLQGDIASAISKNEIIASRWPNSESEKHALASLVDLYLQSGDTKSGNELLKGLESKYPDDAVTKLTADNTRMVERFASLGKVRPKGTPEPSSMQKSVAKAIQEKKENLVPKETALHQSYPNPFNPTTNISYSLSAAGMVQLAVFDVLGRKVSEILHEYQAEGNKIIQFDGSALPSGVYFLRLNTAGLEFTQRLLLLK